MIAAGGRPLRISGNDRVACSATRVKSHSTARPIPKPAASPCTSATEIIEVSRTACLSAIRRATSVRMAAASRPARSRPRQKTSPSARIRSTRAVGEAASARRLCSMSSNIAAVISLPACGWSSVKTRLSPSRVMPTFAGETLSFMCLLATRLYTLYTIYPGHAHCTATNAMNASIKGMHAMSDPLTAIAERLRANRRPAGGSGEALSDVVVIPALREAIVSNLLPPGERLTEVTLAARLNVSRTPVREAFAQLEREGLVTIVPRAAVFVREVSERNVEETYTVRAAL